MIKSLKWFDGGKSSAQSGSITEENKEGVNDHPLTVEFPSPDNNDNNNDNDIKVSPNNNVGNKSTDDYEAFLAFLDGGGGGVSSSSSTAVNIVNNIDVRPVVKSSSSSNNTVEKTNNKQFNHRVGGGGLLDANNANGGRSDTYTTHGSSTSTSHSSSESAESSPDDSYNNNHTNSDYPTASLTYNALKRIPGKQNSNTIVVIKKFFSMLFPLFFFSKKLVKTFFPITNPGPPPHFRNIIHTFSIPKK